MAITRRPWADFVVWTPSGLSVERIEWDPQFWEATKEKVVAFYKKAVLPELALPQVPRGQACHQNFVLGDFGPGGPKSPILFRGDFGPPDQSH